MAEDDGFLGRWARRKQAQKAAPPAAEVAPKPDRALAGEAPNKRAGTPDAAAETETVDLASLPPIESLGAESDYTAFLRPGVPASLRLAALRQLWLSEPSVRNYEALVDYAWDFNAPGYGKLLPTDDVEKLLKAVFRDNEKPGETEKEAPAQAEANVSEPPKIAPQHDNLRRGDAPAAFASATPLPSLPKSSQSVSETYVATATPDPSRKRHGAALPRAGHDDAEG